MLNNKVYFKISLYPENIETIENVINNETFQKYLCDDFESDFVISHLYSIYKNNLMIDNILNIEYISNGNFTCEIREQNVNKDDYSEIKEILWPNKIDDKYFIYINEIFYNINFQIENIELPNTEDKCQYCCENYVEHTCTDCVTKICYLCRDRCSNCMETLCPNCYPDKGLCSSCLEDDDYDEDY